jgi:hypothetical protein
VKLENQVGVQVRLGAQETNKYGSFYY